VAHLVTYKNLLEMQNAQNYVQANSFNDQFSSNPH